MTPATRVPRPRAGIALFVGVALALVVASAGAAVLSADEPVTSSHVAVATESEAPDTAGAHAAVEPVGELAQRHAPRQPLTLANPTLVALLVIAAAVATGLRYTISGVPPAGRATAGLRPPPLVHR